MIQESLPPSFCRSIKAEAIVVRESPTGLAKFQSQMPKLWNSNHSVMNLICRVPNHHRPVVTEVRDNHTLLMLGLNCCRRFLRIVSRFSTHCLG